MYKERELFILICSYRGEVSFQAFFAECVKAGEGFGAGEGFVADFAREKFFFDFALQFRVLLRAFSRASHRWCFCRDFYENVAKVWLLSTIMIRGRCFHELEVRMESE